MFSHLSDLVHQFSECNLIFATCKRNYISNSKKASMYKFNVSTKIKDNSWISKFIMTIIMLQHRKIILINTYKCRFDRIFQCVVQNCFVATNFPEDEIF